MNKYWLMGFLSLAILAITAGCTHTRGRDFAFQNVTQLQLGQTTKQDALLMFGEPKVEKEVSNDFNDYTLLSYVFVEVNNARPQESFARAMTLEFVDNKLNGYLYSATTEGELGPRNLNGKSHIHRQASTRDQVVAAIGQPDGKAYYTTTLEIFAEGSGEEIWVYDQEVRQEDNSVIAEKTLVGFDRNGIVDNITTARTKIN